MAWVLVWLLALGGGATVGCGKSKRQKRREATLKQLAKLDCTAISAKAKRCDDAVRKAADEKQRQLKKRHLAMLVTLGLSAFKDVSRCRKHVEQRVGFLRKSCRKYQGAADFCRRAQQKYFKDLKALQRCFRSDDCAEIARCYVDHSVATLR